MRTKLKALVLLSVLALIAAACTGDDGGETEEPTGNGNVAQGETGAPVEEPATGEYPRDETLYIGGTQWGPPSNWNPLRNWDYATGTVNFVYETMFLYDPLTSEFTPWLAESGDPSDPASWPSENVYEVTIRDGITWTDGEPLTAEDVKFTIELAQYPTVPYSTIWGWIDSVEVEGNTVRVTFTEPNYQEWANWVYQSPIVPQHLWADVSEDDLVNGANENPIGSGPYLFEAVDQDRMVWRKNTEWWGIEQLGLDPKPTYIVDIVNSSNNVALGLVLQGGVDLNNNFLPGVARLIQGGYGLQTFYPEPPYMLSANTAWLFLNTTRPPMDDPAFRRALATSINVDQIVNGVYGDIVLPASPTGLLPTWEQYIDQSVVDELGFSYDPDEARRLLAEAGYEDSDGDGFVENLDGSPVELHLMVPNGWTDWMESIRVISESAAAVGINVVNDFPDYNALVEQRNSGDYDMVIANDKQVSATPWEYYDYVFRMPVQDVQTVANYGRYENEEAWALVQQLDRTPLTDTAAMQDVLGQIEEIFLEELPVIPLWYNGMWSQASNAVWTNWPSADGAQILPSTWRNYWQLGAIYMLDQIQPVFAE